MLLSAVAGLSRALPAVRGRGRVALALHQLGTHRGVVAAPMRRGFCMEVPANSAQTWRAAFTGSYDDEEIDLLLPFVTDGSLTLDIGSSLGFYTVPFALAAQRRDGHVVAVDPVAANCAVLRRNLERNRVADVVSVVQVALGARRGEVLLHVETGGTGNATIVTGLPEAEVARHDRAGGTGSAEVAQVRPLDDIELPAGRPCGLVKIDAEGFDLDVLAGAEAFIARHRPVIAGEFSPSWLTTRGIDPMAPVAWAEAHGYASSELVYARRHALSERQSVSLRPLSGLDGRSGTGLVLMPRDHAAPRGGDARP